jgi:hypothetical protein
MFQLYQPFVSGHAQADCNSHRFIFFSVSCRPSDNIEPTPIHEAEVATQSDYSDLQKLIYGEPSRDGIIYQPVGVHTKTISKHPTNNNLIGVVYQSFSAGTFINLYDDRTWYLVVMRNVYSERGFGIGYFAGVLFGY